MPEPHLPATGDATLRVLLRIARAARQGLAPAEFHQQVTRDVMALLGAERAALFWRSRSDAPLSVLAAEGVPPAYTAAVLEHHQASAGGLAANLRQAVLISDLFNDPRVAPEVRSGARQHGLRALLVLPLGLEDRQHGALALYWTAPLAGAPGPDRGLGQLVADHVTLALLQARAQDEATGQAASRLRQLEDASRSLSDALDELVQVDRLKGDFLSAVSHELRTPLTTILGFSEFLEEGVAGPLTPEQRRFVGHITQAGQHLSSLVDDLLDFARMEAGSFLVDLRPVEVEPIVDEVVEGLQTQAAAAGLQLRRELALPLPVVTADARRLRQILMNLISNGLKFTRPGGEVKLIVTPSPWVVRFEVHDTGIGIPREHHPRLFKKFYRVTDGPNAPPHGTGLGLAITHQLVQAQQGNIGFESEPGRGSLFWFELPVAAEA
ncbi:MAG: GAF domain-containing sensor histidine kinase [Candidatus Sericytochromatia bacterium]|nr:GAF domain-containing sensor histidine kinase [Candidatus Sericytochromatia bacterium]